MTVLDRVTIVIGGDTTQLLTSLRRASQTMEKAGRRMTMIGSAMATRISLPIAAIGGVSVKMAADFDTSMRKIVGLVGIQRDIVDGWRKDVRALAVQYGSSATEAADALFFITSAGLRGAEAMDTLEASMKASMAGMGGIATLADAATSAMNAYGSASLSAERALEILTGAVRAGKLETAALAPVIGNVVGTAAAMRISFEQVAGVLAVFSRVGVDAATGATSLQAIMSILLGTTTEGEKALAAVNLTLAELRDVAAGPEGLIGVMRKLDEAFEGNQDVLKTVIPNLRAFRGVMNALAQDAKVVDGIMQDTANTIGILDEAAAAAEGPAFRMRQAWSAVKDSFIDIGNLLIPIVIPALQGIANVVVGAVKGFTELSVAVKITIGAFVGLIAVMGPALLLVGAMTTAIGALAASTMTLAISLVPVLGTIGLVAAALVGLGLVVTLAIQHWDVFKDVLINVAAAAAALALVTGVATTAISAFITASVAWVVAIAPAAGLIALIVAAVVALGLGARQVVRHWDYFKVQFLAIWTLLEDKAFSAVEFILNVFSKIPFIGKKFEEARDRVVAAHEDMLVEAAANLAKLEREWAETAKNLVIAPEDMGFTSALFDPVKDRMIGMIAEIKDAVATITPEPPKPVKPPAWIGAAKEAMDEWADSLRQAAALNELLGDSFDLPSAKADAYQSVVQALVEAGVSHTAVIGANGETLQWLAQQYVAMEKAVERAEVATTAFAERQAEVARIIAGIATPLENYNALIQELTDLVLAGDLTWQQYDRAVAQALETLGGIADETEDLGKTVDRFAQQALASFMRFTQGADNAFKQFVDSAIRELQRLAATYLAQKFIKDVLKLKIEGLQHGGFLEAGRVAIVGEAGPELIAAGRSGVTVKPLAASTSAYGGGGGDGGANINLTIQAVDARSFTELVEADPMAVVAPVVKAIARSNALKSAIR